MSILLPILPILPILGAALLMQTQLFSGLIEFLQLLLGFFLEARIILGQAIGMPDKCQVPVGLIHIIQGCSRLQP
jgi:hypothetical protein